MFSNNIIKKSVMSVINERIAKAQDAYDKDVEELEAELEKAKEERASHHVGTIIGKII